ncbi:NADH-quinone oxidoreductase subunit N [Planctomicrobium sp. SH668]|uniref:NADH-quinone oxidoreductase subunit N n=1 Tax=Planctomicrobium sp. SH668 TaxID=3448126 RepID=UPI003F5B979E
MATAIEQINNAAGLIVPEIILLATTCFMFLASPFLVSTKGQEEAGLRHRWGILSLLALGTAGWVWFQIEPQAVGTGPFRVDPFVCYVRGLSLVFGAILVLVLWNQVEDIHSAEAHACLLAIIAGVNFTVVSNDLVGIFLGLELVSIPTYVLLAVPKHGRNMREATIKYFLLSVFSSALVLYGLAWTFGAAGTTNVTGIANAISQASEDGNGMMLQLALAFIVAGLGFRITAVPFQFYAPDVFQGTTSSIAAMLSFVPKIVGFAALLRLIPLLAGATSIGTWTNSGAAQCLLATLAILTMFGGNLLALRQTNLQRLLAYSSVAHAGYLLVGLTMGGNGSTVSGASALLFYLPIYGLMTIGVFALIACAGTKGKPLQTVSDLAGLSKTRPAIALLLAVCLFSLTGMPPTAGLLGKLNLFLAAWSSGSVEGQWLAALLAVNALIAAWYYLRLVGVMYFEAPAAETKEGIEPASGLAGVICSLGTIVLFIAPQWLWDAVQRAVGS